jgi:hypothetical protein
MFTCHSAWWLRPQVHLAAKQWQKLRQTIKQQLGQTKGARALKRLVQEGEIIT